MCLVFVGHHLCANYTAWGTGRNFVVRLLVIYLSVDILPSTETLNFLFDRKELINLAVLTKNCNSDNIQ